LANKITQISITDHREVINYQQEAQLLLGDRATRKHAKWIAEMDVEMTT